MMYMVVVNGPSPPNLAQRIAQAHAAAVAGRSASGAAVSPDSGLRQDVGRTRAAKPRRRIK
jgi:hypothetical protein